MEQKIEWISEAFSMQPNRITIVNPYNGIGIWVDEVKLCKKQLTTNEEISYYQCFKDGNIISEWRADTMNVGYKYE